MLLFYTNFCMIASFMLWTIRRLVMFLRVISLETNTYPMKRTCRYTHFPYPLLSSTYLTGTQLHWVFRRFQIL